MTRKTMKSGLSFGFGIVCFLFGVVFYHFILLQDVPLMYKVPSIQSQFVSVENENKGNWFIPLEEIVKGPLAQNDSRLLNYLNAHEYLRPPSGLPYNLTEPTQEDPSMGQSKLVRHALNDLKNGFFVECGALDGELRSNTLVLERKLGWNGLLIEGDPKNFQLLTQKNRKAWISDACLATKKYPHEVMFQQHFNRGRIANKQMLAAANTNDMGGFVKVQCFPFYTLISALNISTVDYFSLDVEGSELDVLKTIPFELVYIKVLSVEYVHDKGGREAVRKYMTSKGFRVFGEVTDPRNWANDLIFVNNRLT